MMVESITASKQLKAAVDVLTMNSVVCGSVSRQETVCEDHYTSVSEIIDIPILCVRPQGPCLAELREAACRGVANPSRKETEAKKCSAMSINVQDAKHRGQRRARWDTMVLREETVWEDPPERTTTLIRLKKRTGGKSQLHIDGDGNIVCSCEKPDIKSSSSMSSRKLSINATFGSTRLETRVFLLGGAWMNKEEKEQEITRAIYRTARRKIAALHEEMSVERKNRRMNCTHTIRL
ncbi:hypothetical protein R3P38DRAFT_2770351 [Favolaschia claudopus]|uniref:Uncharacterized protein n=1 Tax=Favolaschia claudopus TaxID=2862362 RepID=A0AAW0CG37_9AGAR